MRVLVTGGSGFVGTTFLRLLKTQGHTAVNIDIVPSNNPEVEEHIVDLTKKSPDIRGDICFHLASGAGGILVNQKADIIEYNNAINRNVLNMSKGIPLVFISTLNVFENAFSVNEWTKPATPYAISKYEGENLFKEKINTLGRLTIVRPSNLFGSEQIEKFSSYGESHVIPDMLHKIKNSNKKLEVWGDGTQKRNFLHVMDFCAFLLDLMHRNNQGGAYNVCSAITLSIGELAQELMNFSDKKLDIEYKPEYMKYEKMFIDRILDQLTVLGIVGSFSMGLEI